MKQNKAQKVGTESTRMNKSRWRRSADGKLHYAGVCPFNNLVCLAMNAIVGRKHKNEAG